MSTPSFLKRWTASSGANKSEIWVNCNTNLAFNPNYIDKVIIDRSGNISSRGLNMSNFNGLVCDGASEFGSLQNIGKWNIWASSNIKWF